MQKGDVIVIIYQNKTGQFSRRRVRIISVGETYITAYCYNRQQVRTFAVERILASQRVSA